MQLSFYKKRSLCILKRHCLTYFFVTVHRARRRCRLRVFVWPEPLPVCDYSPCTITVQTKLYFVFVFQLDKYSWTRLTIQLPFQIDFIGG